MNDLSISELPIYAEFDLGKTIVDLFETQARLYPDNTAIEFNSKAVTYGALKNSADRLAYHLRSIGIREGDLVPLFIERSVEMIVAIFGVLKSGAAYVPIDLAHPGLRIVSILRDCESSCIVTNTRCAGLLPAIDQTLILLDREDQWMRKDLSNLQPDTVRPDHLAYVIYTSGSTGRPKGVMIEHRNVTNLIQNQGNRFSITKDDRILLFSNYCFDASVEQIFLALLHGAALILFREGLQLETSAFENFIEEQRITHLHATPSFLSTLSTFNFKYVKRIIAGGEVCYAESARRTPAHIDFFNEYGPTETTVTSTEYQYNRNDINELNVLPIGSSLPNYFIYLLDEAMNLQADGMPGEMYIGGAGVARGYLNNPALSASAFLKDPFVNDPSARMYRTGDYAKRLADGELVFLGRLDEQIKIRGYRIEPGEIENVMLQSGVVDQCAVVARNTPDGAQLIAIVVPSPGAGFDIDRLFDHLRQRLPFYMIPAHVVTSTHLPLTSNGKIDKAELLKMGWQPTGSETVTGPIGKTESQLISIWKKLLSIESVGTRESFFKLGGHSLLLVKLSLEIKSQFGLEIPADIIFDDPTIEKLARYIGERAYVREAHSHEIKLHDQTGVSLAQKHLYMARRFHPTESFPNSSITYEISGKCYPERIEKAVIDIIQKNESLRTSYHYQKGKVTKKISSNVKFKLDKVNSKDSDIDEILHELTQPFDFALAPLIRVFYIETADVRKYLHIDMPHINSDGMSCNIIINSIINLYNGSGVEGFQLQYSDFQKWVDYYHNSEQYNADQQFWLGQRLEKTSGKILQPKKGFESIKTTEGVSMVMPFEQGLSDKIHKATMEKGITKFQFLLAGYLLLLFKNTQREGMNIMIPVHNRNEEGFDRIIGLLANTLIVPFSIDSKLSVTSFLEQVKTVIFQAMAHERYPFENVSEDYRARQCIVLHQTFFNYHNFIEDLATEGAVWQLHFHAKRKEILPLSVDIYDVESQMKIRMLSVLGYFDKQELESLAMEYFVILDKMVSAPDTRVDFFITSLSYSEQSISYE